MRRIVLGLLSTVSAVVLLFSYHTSTNSMSSTQAGGSDDDTGPSTDPSSTGTGTGSTGTGSGTAGSTDPETSSGSSSSGSYTGDAADTRWGTVQVRITVKNGKITASEAVEYPTQNGRDQEINSYAVPALNAEVVTAQSGGIDAISGATVTSDGYIQSLQSAIDQAGL